jgi:uncharacterized Zn finger protein
MKGEDLYDDGIVQSWCNSCGGQLEILVVDRTNPFPYRCSKCGQVPSSVDRVEVPNLAKTYVVNLNYKKGKETL